MWLSRYFTLFVVYSCMGWIYETLFCTVKTKKWENRGFLYGPICPIYGAGAVGATIVVDLVSGIVVSYSYTWWQVFLVSFFGSIVLEYVTSWGLEKLFHAYWWDYSDMPLNINGRVCFPCSCGFGLAGLLVVYVILPYTIQATSWITPILYEAFALLFMCLVSIDTTLTVSALTNFALNVESFENALNAHMDQFVIDVQDGKYTPVAILSEGKQVATAKLTEGKQAASARLEEGKIGIEDKLLAERERFSKEHMEQLLSSFGVGSKAALRRVQGFRPRIRKGNKPEIAENNKRVGRFSRPHVVSMNYGLKMLKDKLRSPKCN